MTTPLVKSLIDEQVSNLEQAFRLPRETLVKHLPKPIKGYWQTPPSGPGTYVLGDFGYDLRGRMVIR